MSKSNILARPEFAVLKRLSVEQLRRIDPETCGRYGESGPGNWGLIDGLECPMEQAFEWRSPVAMGCIDVATALRHPRSTQFQGEAFRFIEWNDNHADDETRRTELAAAVEAAIAEREGQP